MTDLGSDETSEVEYECENGHRFTVADEPQHPHGGLRGPGDEQGVDAPEGIRCPECGSPNVTRVQAEGG